MATTIDQPKIAKIPAGVTVDPVTLDGRSGSHDPEMIHGT